MRRLNVIFAVITAGALAACQTGAEKKADESTAQSPQQSAAPAGSPAAMAPTDSALAPDALPETTAAPEPSQPAEQAAPTAAPVRRAPRASSRTRTAQAPPRQRTVYTTRRAEGVEPLDLPPGEPEVGNDAGRSEAGVEVQAPRRDVLVIPPGTELRLILENALSSETSHAGDAVTARVERATGPDGRVVLPGGTVLKGSVYRAEQAGRVRGRSHLAVDFNRIVVRGVEHRVDTTAISVEGPESRGRDAAIIGGSTVGGAIVGGILGGRRGAGKGAVVGAAGGTGAVLVTRGKDVELPAGSRWTVRVKDQVPLN